ncbi:MAG TPA: FtsW/RodA/SpoVE family cell cycle protein [Longimicrobium sp.]|jgi:cell division protein FtsW (lipid II flippase)|uniref:FtsW/RodA/SpoVE family cell cycle protein n=1 Tax=Longimicrobium sp. TaxID=2029185 RepID=UPI002ED8893D
MAIRDLFRRGRAPAAVAPEGVTVRIKPHNLPSEQRAGRVVPGFLWWGLLLASAFYVAAHFSIVRGVWPIHGTSPGAGGTFIRDGVALAAWIAVLVALRQLGYRGQWALVVLPILIFSLTRPTQFQIFTDPAYQASGGARARANDLKATRARLSTIERTYSEERKQVVYQGNPPEMPDPFENAVQREARSRGFLARSAAHFSVFIAPFALLVGFLLSREPGVMRWVRDRRLIPFVPTLAVFFVLTIGFTELGKVGGMTPWELFLPIFIVIWAATLAEDAYNLARPGAIMEPRRLLNLFLYGAGPVIPFLIIRELGLSIVLAGSMAAMLLVGTRRGWWAGLMLVVWAALVFAAFNVDERSATRLELAYDPYKNPAEMTEPQRETWAAKLHQMKLFDANVIEGGTLGVGPGRGHAETAPNAADDGFITAIATHWGLAGTVSLVLLYTLFVVQLLSAAARESGAFERTLVTGVAMLIGIPFWLATLGGIRLIPLTGVATAFAAHGGAKLLASAFAVGLAAGVSHRRAREEIMDEALAPPPAEPHAPGIRIR